MSLGVDKFSYICLQQNLLVSPPVYWDTRTPGHQDIETLGHQDTWTPGHWDIGTMGGVGVPTYGNSVVIFVQQ